MGILKWMWRGLITRLGLMAGEIPPPPHLREPELQIDPVEEHDLPPSAVDGDEPERDPQAHPHPAERRGSMQNG